MKIFIIGSNNPFGREITTFAHTRGYQLFACDIHNCNIDNEKQLQSMVKAFSPDVLVDCRDKYKEGGIINELPAWMIKLEEVVNRVEKAKKRKHKK